MTSPLASSAHGIPTRHGLGDKLTPEDDSGGEG
jgi:hypothetical protein